MKIKRKKFKVGEVVVVKQSGVPYKVGSMGEYCNEHKCPSYILEKHPSVRIWDEKDLRPLTKRERGQ